MRRLSPWRSLTEPVYQLEGFSILRRAARVRQIRRRGMGSAADDDVGLQPGRDRAVDGAVLADLLVRAGGHARPSFERVHRRRRADVRAGVALPLAYAIAVLFLEPFYVAAGFGMYLNRRAELEAWDIEQEFRRAFAQ